MQTNASEKKNPSAYQPARIYDMEHHYIPEEIIDYFKTRTDYPICNEYGILYGKESLLPSSGPSFNRKSGTDHEELIDLGEIRLGILDEAGITTGVVSAGQGIEYLPKDEAVKYAQLCNNLIAEAVKKYPGRFLGTITLPTLYVEESIIELERAVKELGLQYWHTHSNYGNEYLYEEKFEPLLAKCAELDVPVYLHPNYPSVDYLLDLGMVMSSASLGFGVDTMRTSMRLIFNGIFDKYPNLIMILGHMGEDYPYTVGRIDDRLDAGKAFDKSIKCKHHVVDYFKSKNIFFTTSGIYDPDVVLLAMKTIGIDNILFGTDFPHEDVIAEAAFVKSLPISDEDKDKILYKNAEKYIFKNRT